MAHHDRITPQQLQDTRQIIGSELYLAFDLLATRLMQGDSAMDTRQRAELREAKRIVYQLKHPDPDMLMSREEMSWALRQILTASELARLYPAAACMRTIARMLSIDIAMPHDLPPTLGRKIENAVEVLQYTHAHDPQGLAAAV